MFLSAFYLYGDGHYILATFLLISAFLADFGGQNENRN
jgi:hypothetical protein